MSQQNVEIVRRVNEAFNRGDLTAFLERTDPNGEWWDRADDPGAAVHRGHHAITKHWTEVVAGLAELRVEPKAFIDAGDSVVVPVRLTGRGRASDVPFDESEVHLFRLRDGKIVEFREYREVNQALQAAGLSE